jgi:nitrite reductase (NADH) small subunit
MKTPHPVCRTSELPPGGKRIVSLDGKSIGVFNLGGEYFALRNVCPHQFAPLCAGKVTGYCEPGPVGEFHWKRAGEIVRCPWHAWEFDIRTGRSIFNPHKVRTGTFPVAVEKTAQTAEGDPTVETFSVSVEEEMVVVYV